jgi:DNA-directed RNA polymerase specialized sigma24 family protein
VDVASLARGAGGVRPPVPRALRLARIKLTEDHAADAAQSVMMKMFARAIEFEPGKPVLPWFYAMAAGELRTVRRRTSHGAQANGDRGEARRR